MNKKQTDKLMNILLGIAAFAIMMGALLKLQHVLYGNEILYFGFISSFIIGDIEIYRLKKIIKVFEKELPKTN